MTQRLNITNGDSAAATLSEAGVEGKIISWRDVLHEGPVDSSLSLEELIDAGHSKPVAAFLEVARLRSSPPAKKAKPRSPARRAARKQK